MSEKFNLHNIIFNEIFNYSFIKYLLFTWYLYVYVLCLVKSTCTLLTFYFKQVIFEMKISFKKTYDLPTIHVMIWMLFLCCDVPITIYYDQVMTWGWCEGHHISYIWGYTRPSCPSLRTYKGCVVIIMLKATIQLTLFKINIYPTSCISNDQESVQYWCSNIQMIGRFLGS